MALALPAREKPTVEYLRLRGRALRAAGRNFDAEASFREALGLAPGDVGISADLATTLLGQGRLKEAIVFAREAVAGKPEVAAYQALLGFLADRLELADEARRALTLARELAPSDAEAHTVFGDHALRNGDLAAAEVAFRDALAADPRRSEALRGLARVALAKRNLTDARRYWLEALTLDPRLRDPKLQRVIVVGHPALAPVHRVMRVPFWVSAVVALSGGCLIAALPAAPAAQAGAVALFAVSAVGPLARRVIVGGLGE